MRYSFCITTLNDASTVRRALDSLFHQLPEDSEVVVVDGGSTDGQLEILQGYPGIRLMVRRTNIGEGKQLALANAKGDYSITGIDCDDVLNGNLAPFIAEYHAHHEGRVLKSKLQAFMGPTGLLMEIGGYKPLPVNEDYEFLQRVEARGFLDRSEISLIDSWVPGMKKRRKGLSGRIRYDLQIFWYYPRANRAPKVSWKTWALYQLVKGASLAERWLESKAKSEKRRSR